MDEGGTQHGRIAVKRLENELFDKAERGRKFKIQTNKINV